MHQAVPERRHRALCSNRKAPSSAHLRDHAPDGTSSKGRPHRSPCCACFSKRPPRRSTTVEAGSLKSCKHARSRCLCQASCGCEPTKKPHATRSRAPLHSAVQHAFALSHSRYHFCSLSTTAPSPCRASHSKHIAQKTPNAVSLNSREP